METVIYRNPEQLEVEEVVKIFKATLEERETFEQDEIDCLSEAYAKNPVDRFIVYGHLDVEAAQGDILIWARGTEMYNKYFPKVSGATVTSRMILQEGDSITGDHRIIPVDGSVYRLRKGYIPLNFINRPHSKYDCLLFETDKPFLIVHREHGNIALPSGEYMFCSQMDSKSLSKVRD